MHLRRLGSAFALTAALVVPVSTSAPAEAVVYDPLAVDYSGQVSGDFEITGNSVVVCPTAAGTPRTECLAASRRENTFNNNRFAMTYADVDGDPSTFNSSTGSVTIPAGSRVVYARLHWAANREGQQCGVGDPGAFPPGSSATQPVTMSVDRAASTSVAPQSYTTDTTSIGTYSADADVTSLLASLPSGRAVPVTVGNVFAPTGNGCFGGWSLVLVHTDDDPACGAQRRQVTVYEGHVRQGTTDPQLDVPVSGIRVDGTPTRVGVTAYEGDNGTANDRLLVNSTPLPEPRTGSTTNFFNSSADGEVDPTYANNFSVDAKRLAVPGGVINPGDTSAVLTFSPTSDTYLLQSLAVSIPVPALCLDKTVSPAVARAGDELTWSITVRNPTTSAALGVAVDDPAVATCNRTLGTLAAGATTTYTCTSVARADLENVATATGTGAGGTLLSASGAATVSVERAGLELTKTADVERAVTGDTITWTIAVANTGAVPLLDVAATDPVASGCDRTFASIGVGASESWTCTTTAGKADETNTAEVTATTPAGQQLTDSAQAAVDVTEPEATVEITTTPEQPEEDSTVEVTIDITNTGDVELDDGTIEVTGAPGCDEKGLSAAPGESTEITCTVMVEESVKLQAQVELQPVLGGQPAGPPLVVRESLVVKTAPATAPQGGETPVGGVLPNTGLSGSTLPLGALGLVFLGGGAWLIRRSRV